MCLEDAGRTLELRSRKAIDVESSVECCVGMWKIRIVGASAGDEGLAWEVSKGSKNSIETFFCEEPVVSGQLGLESAVIMKRQAPLKRKLRITETIDAGDLGPRS